MTTETRPTRGHRFWDLTSSAMGVAERLPTARTMHQAMRNATGLHPGAAVLDLGCGTGSYFEPLREAIGPEGRLLGVDSSPGMLRRARKRVHRHGWQNVDVQQADATTTDLGTAEFDAVFAMYSLSAMPDTAAATQRIHTALRPGGVLFLADVRLVPEGRAAGLVRLLRSAYRKFSHATGEDVVPHVRRTFGAIQTVDHDGRPGPDELRSWPPLVMLTARKEPA
ncbi:class I SAM-dependent methyltransferase [Saccharopolyspora sp. K220]|uniref:class I SAM-dependent methyltransferase n=1 Tax=Saccharopolyspora soli TaxID=2926618 RepID=UPI001F5893D7|nr:class I SAM-dependent methyltransferase [Saccharopolyspora soli]MCI2422762.1 class I SAM-dependent methyltransferase [Saccharopolyspora soli]